jgi:hypothetical protein
MDTHKGKLQEHIIAEKQTNKQAKMIRKDNYEQNRKHLDCETRYYNSNNSIKLVMIRI